jgi:cardiolipin synthase
VGSSNLDPLSLALNLEANVVIRDRDFNATLRERLAGVMRHSCTEIDPQHHTRRSAWRVLVSTLAFHVLRRFPDWAGWLPAHQPRLARGVDVATRADTLPVTAQAADSGTPPQPWRWRGGGTDRVDDDPVHLLPS